MKNTASAIETIHGTHVWQTVKQAFEAGAQSNYIGLLAGQCKSAVSALYQECARGKSFIPAHPAGTHQMDAFHCYGLLGPVLGHDPAQDIIIDPTIGQIIASWGPYIGTRADLKMKLKSAFDQGAINPGFMRYLSRQISDEAATDELIFKTYYGENSWGAFTNKKLKRGTIQP